MLSCSIGILSYNEAKNIPIIVKKLVETFGLKSKLSLNVVIINNGSTDETAEVIKELENKYNQVSHIYIPINRGYGYGVKQGLTSIVGDVVGFMWGDNQFDVAIVAEMVDEFVNEPNVQFVKTYRVKRYDGHYRVVISWFYQILFKILYGGRIRDINSGPKLFRFEFLQKIFPLKSNDWFIDAEIMIKAVKVASASQIKELPIDFFPRKFGKSNVKFKTCLEFVKNLFYFKFKNYN